MKTTKEFIYFRESALQSIIADTYSYGALVGAFWINYKFVGSNGLLSAVILVMFLLLCISKASNKKQTFVSKESLIGYLEDDHA